MEIKNMKKIDIWHFTIDYYENLGAFYFLQKLEQGFRKYNVNQKILILGQRKEQDKTVSDNVFFYNEININQLFHEMDKNTVLIFHESFATYARKDRELPADLYELSCAFTRLRMIHDYSTAICPMALDIEKYKLCKGTINADCLYKNCIDREVYQRFINSIQSLNEYDGIMCLSKDTIHRMVTYGVDEEKLFQIPPLIKEETIFLEKVNKSKKILYASRICAQKGLLYLVEALSRLKSYNWELLVAGSPEETGYYLKVFRLARREQIEDRIRILGHLSQDELRKVRRESDIFCFPSIGSETYGFSGAEAILSGMPVIAFDIDGVNEWLVDGQTGYLCKHLDVDDMAEKIKELLINEKTYNEMKKNCIKAAGSNHYEEQLQMIYQYIINLHVRSH